MQQIYNSHPAKLALIHNTKILKEDLETTITVQNLRFGHNNPRNWDIAVNNYLEAIWIRETRY